MNFKKLPLALMVTSSFFAQTARFNLNGLTPLQYLNDSYPKAA